MVFLNLISVTFHHFCHILLVRSKFHVPSHPQRNGRLHKSMNSRRWDHWAPFRSCLLHSTPHVYGPCPFLFISVSLHCLVWQTGSLLPTISLFFIQVSLVYSKYSTHINFLNNCWFCSLRTSNGFSYSLPQTRYWGTAYLELINFSHSLLYRLYLQPNWTLICPCALPVLFSLSAQTIPLANTTFLPLSSCKNPGQATTILLWTVKVEMGHFWTIIALYIHYVMIAFFLICNYPRGWNISTPCLCLPKQGKGLKSRNSSLLLFYTPGNVRYTPRAPAYSTCSVKFALSTSICFPKCLHCIWEDKVGVFIFIS